MQTNLQGAETDSRCVIQGDARQCKTYSEHCSGRSPRGSNDSRGYTCERMPDNGSGIGGQAGHNRMGNDPNNKATAMPHILP